MQGTELSNFINTFPALKTHFQGVFSINTMPKGLKKRNFFFANTDESFKPGTHWFFVFCNDKNQLELFDSLGVNDEKLARFLKFNKISKKEIVYNDSSVQKLSSNLCGYFVLYFALNRLFNVDLSFKNVINEIFDSNPNNNDDKVRDFLKELNFDGNL